MHVVNNTRKQITLENEIFDVYNGVDSRYWRIPPEIYESLDREFHFNFDPCPYPFERDGIDIEWGKTNWVNPPFRRRDAINGHGPTAFVRKGIEEAEHGKTSVFILPVQNYVNMLLWGGAEIRPLGRVNWLDDRTGKAMKVGSNNAIFVLRGKN